LLVTLISLSDAKASGLLVLDVSLDGGVEIDLGS
jgi:hypothetical protein